MIFEMFSYSRTAIILLIMTMNSHLLADETQQQADSSAPSSNNNSIYPTSFFNQYTPQNALEMIERLPGFIFDKSSNARGFGGNAGNVLIDGMRPTSKSGGLQGALIRIPAEQVLRIEILRGGIGAGEAASQLIVANVIRKNSGTSGTWALKTKRAPAGAILSYVEATVTTQLGEWKMSFDSDIGGQPGYRSALIESLDVNDVLISSADEVLKTQDQWVVVNGEGARKLAGGKFTLNGAINTDHWKADLSRDAFISRLPDNNSPDAFWKLHQNERNKSAELAADWTKIENDWRWRIIGLSSAFKHHYNDQFYSEDKQSNSTNESQFVQDSLKTESIVRATYGEVGSVEFKPEYGIEFASNRLTSNLKFEENGLPQQLQGANVKVEELRAEAFANFVYKANPKLIFEGGITLEYSEINVSGDASQKQSFRFLKPQVSANYEIDENSRFSLEVGRSVGQLDFNDFAASSQAQDDRTTSGNPDLKPDNKTGITATYDWSFSERGSLKFEALYEWRKDILEQIILPSGNQGLGNAGDATFWGITTDINLPLDAILENGLLEIRHIYRESDFEDLIVKKSRLVTDYTPRLLTFEFRQDISQHQFSWGVEYWGKFKDTNFLVDEIQTFSGNRRIGRIFIETTRFFGVKILLEVFTANTAKYTRSRFFYENDRSGAYQGSEIAHRERRPEVKLSFSGTF